MLDKEGPPPGVDESQRLVVLLGDQAQVRAARAEIDLLITNPHYRAGRRLERGQLANSLNPNPDPDPDPDPSPSPSPSPTPGPDQAAC